MAIAGREQDRLFFHRSDHPVASSFEQHELSDPKQSVSCITLSSQVIRARELFGTHKDVCIKLDCEGAEWEIFNHDPDWMDMVSLVTMEWHNYDGDNYATILKAHGFEVELTGTGPKPAPAWDKSMARGMLYAKHPARYKTE